MKKYFLITLFILAAASIVTACQDEDNDLQQPQTPEQPQEPQEPENPEEPVAGKILIAYFSYPEPDGVDAVTGASRLVKDGSVIGHVEFLAKTIQEATNGDLFEIRTVQQYPASHELLVAQAREEKDTGARPALATQIENLEQYDIIFIGYPNWWGDLPMPLYTFLDEYDFKGKTIAPFNSHGGSGLSGTVNTIRTIQPNATVTAGFTVSRNTVGDAKNNLIQWLKEIEIIK